MRAPAVSAPGVLLAAVLLAACAGGATGGGGGALPPCGPAPSPAAEAPDLPPGFPTPDGVTYTAAEPTGPSLIVEGYVEGDIGPAFEAYRAAFRGAGYGIPFEERETIDAEVNFAGGDTTGQVRLRQECDERTELSITIRPN